MSKSKSVANPNWPSKTGNKSGGGRGNNPPKTGSTGAKSK